RMRVAEGFLKVTGAENMDDLMALTEEELLIAFASDTGMPHEFAHPMRPNNCMESLVKDAERFLAAKNTYTLRGGSSIVPENPYQAIADGVSKDIDVLAGTNADEMRYFIPSMCAETDEENLKRYYTYITEMTDEVRKNSAATKKIVDTFLKTANIPQDEYSEQYPGIWEKTAIFTDFLFRLPEIKTAESHIASGGEGKTYMYLFGRGNPEKPHYGAGHGVELPYVFCNFDAFVSGGGTVDPVLADKISSMWINFAKTGNPSIEGFEWTEYTLDNRATMVVGQDSSLTMVNDPKGEQREMLMPLLDELFPMKA
ncbi:MAG TPA: carboxylesterase family protein, partial [Methanocorpusculum sp.]|nr:carboxylesterase family protein [Methanocorpusculum sp.]